MTIEPSRSRPIIGLDPGTRRTGVAVSDALGMYAHARPAIQHTSEGALVSAVVRLVRDEDARLLVVGLPMTLGGGASEQTREVRILARRLRGVLPVPVAEWDERFSTRQAEAGAGRASKRRSGEVDSLAAALVLQGYLDAERTRGART